MPKTKKPKNTHSKKAAAIAATALAAPTLAIAQGTPQQIWANTNLDSKLDRAQKRVRKCENPAVRTAHPESCWQAIRSLNQIIQHNHIQEIQKLYWNQHIPTGMMYGGPSQGGTGSRTSPEETQTTTLLPVQRK